jgi:hypothetical protein
MRAERKAKMLLEENSVFIIWSGFWRAATTAQFKKHIFAPLPTLIRWTDLIMYTQNRAIIVIG